MYPTNKSKYSIGLCIDFDDDELEKLSEEERDFFLKIIDHLVQEFSEELSRKAVGILFHMRYPNVFKNNSEEQG